MLPAWNAPLFCRFIALHVPESVVLMKAPPYTRMNAAPVTEMPVDAPAVQPPPSRISGWRADAGSARPSLWRCRNAAVSEYE